MFYTMKSKTVDADCLMNMQHNYISSQTSELFYSNYCDVAVQNIRQMSFFIQKLTTSILSFFFSPKTTNTKTHFSHSEDESELERISVVTTISVQNTVNRCCYYWENLTFRNKNHTNPFPPSPSCYFLTVPKSHTALLFTQPIHHVIITLQNQWVSFFPKKNKEPIIRPTGPPCTFPHFLLYLHSFWYI